MVLERRGYLWEGMGERQRRGTLDAWRARGDAYMDVCVEE
jgi:hypothetical protein